MRFLWEIMQLTDSVDDCFEAERKLSGLVVDNNTAA